MTIIKTEELILQMLDYKGDVVICGLSIKTKKLIKEYNLYKNIAYIFDNNNALFGQKYLSIPIISYKKLMELKNLLIIICEDHNRESFYTQLKNISKHKILVEKRNNLTIMQNKSLLLNFKFEWIVEVPCYIKIRDFNQSHYFGPMLLDRLLYFDMPIKTSTIYIGIDYYKVDKKCKKNNFLSIPKDDITHTFDVLETLRKDFE